ncbi:LytR/AlgR family response regulator transcription factor [Sphingobacterium sp. LRF_L2]|uniref:LytR/AlgR family response regulator transcription factor n=1 Tax=Sphingobacterium sp. LRF_L2 TaxID=3369421 RepID=UPI003F63F61A
MLSCIALDDEPLALRILIEFARRHSAVHLLASFSSPLEARRYIDENKVDLLFLDIDMLEVNGIEFFRELKQKPLLVFTTAHKEYAVEGFEVDAVDYLLKPFDFSRFSRAIEKVQARFVKTIDRPFLSVYSEYQRTKIYLDEIECIESMQDYVKIHLITGKIILTLSTMKAMQERLPPDSFIRIHRSYIVATARILSFSNRKVQLPHFSLSVGESYYKDVIQLFGDSSVQ